MLENIDNYIPELSDMDVHYHNRWYEKQPKLRKFIDRLKSWKKQTSNFVTILANILLFEV